MSPGNWADVSCAKAALGGLRPRRLLADKGYDSNPLRKWLRARRVRPVIPGTRTRKRRIRHDAEAYKGRNVVERFFGRMKDWSCLAMRREKNDASFFSLLCLFVGLDCLRGNYP